MRNGAAVRVCQPHARHRYLQGGGEGNANRLLGVAVDYVVSQTVVLPNGSAVTANSSQHSDLYWALRGGGGPGGNFGIVTEYTVRLVPAPQSVLAFSMTVPLTAGVHCAHHGVCCPSAHCRCSTCLRGPVFQHGLTVPARVRRQTDVHPYFSQSPVSSPVPCLVLVSRAKRHPYRQRLVDGGRHSRLLVPSQLYSFPWSGNRCEAVDRLLRGTLMKPPSRRSAALTSSPRAKRISLAGTPSTTRVVCTAPTHRRGMLRPLTT